MLSTYVAVTAELSHLCCHPRACPPRATANDLNPSESFGEVANNRIAARGFSAEYYISWAIGRLKQARYAQQPLFAAEISSHLNTLSGVANRMLLPTCTRCLPDEITLPSSTHLPLRGTLDRATGFPKTEKLNFLKEPFAFARFTRQPSCKDVAQEPTCPQPQPLQYLSLRGSRFKWNPSVTFWKATTTSAMILKPAVSISSWSTFHPLTNHHSQLAPDENDLQIAATQGSVRGVGFDRLVIIGRSCWIINFYLLVQLSRTGLPMLTLHGLPLRLARHVHRNSRGNLNRSVQ